jgi:outer membrane lipoprotein SlyB
MLVVVFDSESKALEGKRALSQLDSDGSIGLWAYAVVAKNADGTSTVKQGDDTGPIGTLFGTSLGGLIGLLFGPAGLAIGATAGLAERAQAHADRKAKLQEKINQLDSKIQVQLEKAKERRQSAEREAQAKAQILKAKAAKALATAS